MRGWRVSSARSDLTAEGRIPGTIWVLAAVAFAVALGFGVVAPAIPLFAREFGVGKTAIGLAVSVFAFFRFVSALGTGSLVDRFGERRMLVAGLLTVAITTGTAPLAQHYALFVALRGVGGIGSAAFTVSATTLVLRLAPSQVRGRATNRYQSGFLFGGVMGPGIGGPLTDIDPRMPFFFYAGTLVVASVVALVGLRRVDTSRTAGRPVTKDPDAGAEAGTAPPAQVGPEGAEAIGSTSSPGPAAKPPTRLWPEVRSLLAQRAYLAAIVVNFGTGWTLFGVRNSLVPLYVVEDLGLRATFTGVALLVGSAFQAVALLRAGWFTDVVGRRPAVLLGTSLATVAMGMLALPGHLVALLVSSAVLGLAASLLGSAPSAIVGDISPGRSGRSVALFQMSSDMAAVIGPLVAGAVADAYSTRAAFAVTAAVMSIGIVAGLRMPETRRTPS